MALRDTHKEYTEFSGRWGTSRASIGGQDVIKGFVGDYSSFDFLPGFVPEDKPRYTKYLQLAIYYNYSGWTHNGIVGAVFREKLIYESSESMEYIKTDIDGEGNGLSHFSENVLSEVVEVGRYGLLVDYSDEKKEAFVKTYNAESIFNWETESRGGVQVLTEVRLLETRVVNGDKFTKTEEEQVRVLALDEDGNYFQQLYDKNNAEIKEQDGITYPAYPRNSSGEFFKEILFQFVGSKNNKPTVDKPPLLDISYINIGHYQNSADYEENIHVHGQSTMILGSSMSVNDYNAANPDGIKVGSRTAHFLGENPTAILLQAAAAGELNVAMEKKVIQMIGIGARFISDGNNETATGKLIDASMQTSGLNTLVNNCEQGVEQCIVWIDMFMNKTPQDYLFELNRDFFDKALTAQEIIALVMLKDSSVMAVSDIRRLAKRAGFINNDRTDEDIDEEISGTSPIG